ncbi:MAG: hypothetical protein ACLQPD_04005 [Desulfomonilaceae bacterium]
MTGKVFWGVLQIIWFVFALSGCSGKQDSDNEYLSKSAKAVVFFSTSSESFFRNLSADPKEAKSDSFERYSQLLLNNFMAVRNLETFKNYAVKLNRTALNLIQDVANPPVRHVQLHKQVLAMYYEYKNFTGAINEARVQTGKDEIFKSLDAAISTMFKLKNARENLEAQFPTEIYKKALDAETKQHQDLIDTIKKLKR